jgi:hypothetical protein
MAVRTDPQAVWKEYQRGLDYQVKMGFQQKWPENVRFVEGNQWPAVTERTRNFPRPVINQIDFIVENKISNILSQTLKMVYSPEEIPQYDEASLEELNQAADDMSDMAQNTWNDIDQDSLNEDCVFDTLVEGTGIYHYYFDNSIKGGMFTQYVGAIQGEIIDPMDIFLGNPQLKPSKLQKQPWIIIRTREDVDTIKEQAKKGGGEPDKVVADEKLDEMYDNSENDITEPNKATCLTKYYKKNGEVFWCKVTDTAIVQKERRLAPDTSEKPFELYPVEMVVFKRKKKCSFGRSIVEDIINNQRALNFNIAMLLYSVQQTAWPKILAKMGALADQVITNDPGEIITDNFGSQAVDGIKYMQPPNFSNMPISLTDKILELTRQVTGATEVNTGEAIGANMAASAIIALQNQAKKPNERYVTMLRRSIKNIGRIWEEFYKCFYNLPRPVTTTDQDGNEYTKTFTGSEYANMGFGLSIDVGAGSIFDESLQVGIVEKLYDKEDIDKYQYIRYLPQNAVNSEMRQDFEKEEKQLAELENKVKQKQMELMNNGVLPQGTNTLPSQI